MKLFEKIASREVLIFSKKFIYIKNKCETVTKGKSVIHHKMKLVKNILILIYNSLILEFWG